MLLKHIIVTAICGSILVSLRGFGQEKPMSKADVSIEASVPFVDNKNSDGVQQSTTINHGFLGGYRFFFNKHSGVELSYGYAHSIQAIGRKNNSDEVLAALDPKTVAGAITQTRLGYPYGDGADFNLKHRIFPRTAHRGVFYNSATFNTGGLNSLDWIPNRVKPAAVFGYSF